MPPKKVPPFDMSRIDLKRLQYADLAIEILQNGDAIIRKSRHGYHDVLIKKFTAPQVRKGLPRVLFYGPERQQAK